MDKKILFSSIFVLTLLLTTIASAVITVPGDYPTIEQAITAATPGDEIIVADGTYTPLNASGYDLVGKLITLKSQNGPLNCIINCNNAGRAFYFHNGETNATVIQGFTITDGNEYFGGAIECEGASPKIDNCILTNNIAEYGGAIDCFAASPLIKNCIINYNISIRDGAAIECESVASPEIKNCLITDNLAGGIGAIDCYESSSPAIKNCTIADNTDTGGISADISSTPTIINSILWNNGDDLYGAAATHSCIQDGDSGTGNISSNPLFVTGPGPFGNYYLRQFAAGQQPPYSNCVDAGDSNYTSVFGAEQLTTKTNNESESGASIVDMGFHYKGGATAVKYILITSVVNEPNGHGSIDPNYPAPVDPNNPDPNQLKTAYSQVTITASPNANYVVKKWIIDGFDVVGSFTQYTITMNTNHTVSVEFESSIQYQLTTSVINGNGQISPASGPQVKDTVVPLIATPNDANYTIKKWTGTDNDACLTTTNFVTMTGNKTVSVEFKPIVPYLLNTQVINDSNGLPHGTILPRRGYFASGSTVTLTAVPDPNYEVIQWVGTDNDANLASINSVTMNSNPTTVKVEFGLKPTHTLTVIVDSNNPNDPLDKGGTVSPLGGTYYEGNVVTLTAEPNMGWVVELWKSDDPCDGTSTANTFNVTMNADKIVHLYYQYAITVSGTTTRYKTIQAAINAATVLGAGTEVNVPDGNWSNVNNCDLRFKNKPIIVKSVNGPNSTIIDCNWQGRGVTFPGPNDPCDPNATSLTHTLRGFTIIDGNATDKGGGIFADVNATPQIENCIISNCKAKDGGGGIYFAGNDDKDVNRPTVSNCKITGNTTTGGHGGGLYFTSSNAIIRSTEITYNTASHPTSYGGGVYCKSGSEPAFINCLIHHNRSYNYGGAFYLDDSDAIIKLCTLMYNQGLDHEGGIYARNSSPDIDHCIIGRSDGFGGVWGGSYNGHDLTDCTATYTCTEEDAGSGTGNMSNDPLFITGILGDYYLSQTRGGQQSDSPCVDAGEAYYLQDLQAPLTDEDGYGLETNITTGILNVYDIREADMGYHYQFHDGNAIQYDLILNVVSGHGTLDANDGTTLYLAPGTYHFAPGTQLTLTAHPDPNYRVKQWTGTDDDSSFSVTNTVTLYNNTTTVTVEFELIHKNTIHVPGTYPYISIQDAIAMAKDGDTVLIASDHYYGTKFTISGKNITITSDKPNDPNATVIDFNDGEGVTASSYGFYLYGSGTGSCVLQGLTLRNITFNARNGLGGDEAGENGAGAQSNLYNAHAILISGDHTVSNCIIRDISVRGGTGGNGYAGGVPPQNPKNGGRGGDGGYAVGAGIFIVSGNPTIQNCIFENCTATAGGGGLGANGNSNKNKPSESGVGGRGGMAGLAAGSAICVTGANPIIINCTIKNCMSIGGHGGDGGNSGWGAGLGGYGGLAEEDPAQDSPIDHSAIGGAIYVDSGSGAAFINCTITNNFTEGSVSGIGGLSDPENFTQYPLQNTNIPSLGGGIYCGSGSITTFSKCNIQDNNTTAYDDYYTGYGGGVATVGAGYIEFNDCNISGNFSPVGGGIYGKFINDFHIDDCNISGNASYLGGGIFVTDSYFANINNSIIKGNSATFSNTNPDVLSDYYGSGGGIYSFTSDALISDCVITENATSGSGGGVYFGGHPDSIFPLRASPEISNCLITKNRAGLSGGGVSSEFSAEAAILNSTIADNTVSDMNSIGGGLFCAYDSNTIVRDTIFWGNSGMDCSQIALTGGGIFTDLPAKATVTFSDIQESNQASVQPLDVVICIDTTGSMGAVLDSIKTAAADIVDVIAQKTPDYRIAVVDFRDFPTEPYGSPGIDYPYNDDSIFTADGIIVQDAINSITLGYGNDWEESVYSALMHCINGSSLGDWREATNVRKIIILMGDAPPHDPEPFTNYVLGDVTAAARNKNISIYSILTGYGVGNPTVTSYFDSLASDTGGVLIETPDGSKAAESTKQAINLATSAPASIYVEADGSSLAHWNLVSGWNDVDSNNIHVDPNFVSDMDYYLSHILTGQNVDSACINKGSDLATSLGLSTPYTTRIDGIGDINKVDIGFHHLTAAPKCDITVKILADANYPGINGHIIAEPNMLDVNDSNSTTYVFKFYKGSIPKITAVADANYYVKGWYDHNDVIISNLDYIKLTADVNSTYYVRFKPMRTIQVSGGGINLRTAVANAENGDKLIVAAGTYAGDVNIAGKQIKLYGVNPDDPTIVERTIIDCTDSLRGFIFTGGEDSRTVINGFTIRDGGGGTNNTTQGGAIFIDANSSPLIINVDIVNCNVNANGGAIYINRNSSPEFRNVSITNCSSERGSGGGIYISNYCYPIFKQCSITECSAELSGGALYCGAKSEPNFTDCIFNNNNSITAGAICYGSACGVNLESCQFTDNQSYDFGGAVVCGKSCVLDVNDCNVVSNNTYGYAGGFYIGENCIGDIYNTNMSYNTADEDGGAIYIEDANTIGVTDCNIAANTALRGGGIFALTSLNSSEINISACQIKSNRAETPGDETAVGQGGGIYAFSSITRLLDCQVVNNTASTSGGGIYIGGDQKDVNYPLIKNCLIAKNTSTRDGGGISVNWYATATILNCTIADNRATDVNGLGGGLYGSYASKTIVKDTILWANRGVGGAQIAVGSGDASYPLPADVNITYSDIDLRYLSILDYNLPDETGAESNTTIIDMQTIYSDLNSSGAAKVIVSLVEPAAAQTTNWSSPESVSELQSQIAALQNQALSAVTPSEFTLRHKLTNVAAFSGTVTSAGLNKLLTAPGVAHIEPVRTVYPLTAQGIPLMGASQTRATYNGQNTSIAIVDTGVDYTHPRLGNGGFPNSKVIGGYDTGSGDTDPMPVGEAHGTCCAGIAAGSLGTVEDYMGGVAYSAKIYALKASIDNAGYFLDEDLLAAWDWCISHRNDDPCNPIVAISNSLGGGYYTDATDADNDYPAFVKAAKTANDANITILAASGNDGYTSGISWPAAMSRVISVGAVYDAAFTSRACDVQTQPDRVTCYSNTAEILDILAPSENAYTTDIVGDNGYSSGDYYPYFNGTSSACPYAAGAVAALQSAAKQIRGQFLTPAQVRLVLTTGGDAITDSRVAITKPRVNVASSIGLLKESSPIFVEPSCTISGVEQDTNDTWITTADSNNISDDPNFVPGLSYYLSHKDAHQDFNSPCFDMGSNTAASLGLATYTTRADDFNDVNRVDLGYHYFAGLPLYELTVEISGTALGYIKSPWLAGNTYDVYEGQEIKLEAVPDVNCMVATWFIDDVNTTFRTNNIIITMDKNTKVAVKFTISNTLPDNLYVPSEYPDLGSALNAAKDSDKIILAPGIYNWNDTNFDHTTIIIDGKNVTITSSAPDDPCIVAQTIIRGNGFTIRNVDRTMTLDGITIQDAHYYASTVPCSETWAHSPAGDGYNGYTILGGAIRLYNASPTIRNCQFIECSATASHGCDGTGTSGDGGWAGWAHGGAIGIDGTSNPLIKNCDFVNCYALGGNGGNGAQWGHGGNWGDPLSGRWDFGPYQPYWYYSGKGGALYFASGSKPEIENCYFEGNRAYSGTSGQSNVDGWPNYHYAIDSFGGAIYIARGSEAKITDCIFIDNEADTRGQIGDEGSSGDFVIYTPVVSYGGGICAENTSAESAGDALPVIENCKFTNNRACAGGGVYFKNVTAHISDCSITNCIAMLGGGMTIVNNDSIIYDCNFSNNQAVDPLGQGGAIYCDASNAMFYDCSIQNNGASISGGGAYCTGDAITDPNMHNCLIVNNTAGRDGGGISANWNTQLMLSNCTIADNTATGTGFTGYGGGVSCAYEGYTDIINSIVWGNNAQMGSQISIGNDFDAADKRTAEISVSYCDVQDGQAGVFVDTAHNCVLNWGAGNFSGTSLYSPLFVTGLLGNYYLSQTVSDPNQTVNSACVDAGDGTAFDNHMYRHTTRTDHIIDIADSNVDMGYHYTLYTDYLGDFNFDGEVDMTDLTLFMDYWLMDGCVFPYFCDGRDLNQDGEVDFGDYVIFAGNYGNASIRPNPMTWYKPPISGSIPGSITMTATTATTDSLTIIPEYYFDCVLGGGNNRNWDPCSTFIDTGLTDGNEYEYRVKARVGIHETVWSIIGYAIPGEDKTKPEPNVMTWATPPEANSPYSIRMVATTATDVSGVQYWFTETTGNPGGSSSTSWQDSPIYIDSNLLPSTTYTYKVMARDKAPIPNTTAYSIPASATTLEEGQIPIQDLTPPDPNPSTWAITPRAYHDGLDYHHTMTATTAIDTNSPPVYYWFDCSDDRFDSTEWQLSPTYDTNQSGGANYNVTYKVMTRDSANPPNIGGWSPAVVVPEP